MMRLSLRLYYVCNYIVLQKRAIVLGAIAIGKTLVVTLLLVQGKAEGSSATKDARYNGM